jgi:large subunit ribosomal protein L21
MYAIIRTGGKQAKVQEGDILDIERVRAEGEMTFTPLLFVDGKGKVTSDRKSLQDAKVVARVLGPSAGPKIDIFKYKAKTGYRRRQGHRQKYSRIEITKIEGPKKAPAKKDESTAEADDTAAKKPADQKPADDTAAKKPADQKPADDTAAEKPVTPAAKKVSPQKAAAPEAKKAAPKKTTPKKTDKES